MPETQSHRTSPLLWLGAGAGLLALWSQRFRLREGRYLRRPGKALITGASSGIGAAFARQLAARGYELTLVARRAALLEDLAAGLRERYGVTVYTLPADLAADADRRLVERAIQAGQFDLLVNNAGFGLVGRFDQVDSDRLAALVRLHDEASVALTRAALPGMVARGHGGVIFTSSLTTFLPIYGNAIYAASKVFLNNLAQSLAAELHGTGVDVQALCPGFTVTEFHDTLPEVRRANLPAFVWMQAGAVVEQSLRALGSGEVVFVPGAVNRAIVLLMRLPFARQIALAVSRVLVTRQARG